MARAAALAVAGLTLVGLGVRCWALGGRDLWYDEACSFIYLKMLGAAGGETSVANLLVESTNLPYYLLLWAWTAVAGLSEAGLRSLSVAAATATIPLLAWCAYRLAGPRTAVIAAALAALHPLHVYYAREARAYALWLLLLTAAFALLLEAVRRARWTWWAGWGCVTLLALATHYFTLLWLPATAVAVLLAERPRRALHAWLITTTLVGLAFLPYLLLAVLPAARGGGSTWVAAAFDPLTAIPQSLSALLPAGVYPAHLRGLSLASPDTVAITSTGLQGVIGLAPAVLLAIVTIPAARRVWPAASAQTQPVNEHSARLRWVHLALAVLTLGPLLLAWAYSVLIRPVYLVGRYDLVAWPAAVLWIATIVASLDSRRPVRATLVTLALLACSIIPTARLITLQPPPSFAHLRADRLAALTEPGDLAIAFSYDRAGMLYYLDRAGFAGEIESFPRWLDDQVGWVDTQRDFARAQGSDWPAELMGVVADVEHRLDEGHRVLLLSDSLDRIGSSPRAALHEPLFAALRNAGLEASAADGELGIWRLLRQN